AADDPSGGCPAAGAVAPIAAGLRGTEGVAFGDDGTLYVGEQDRVIAVTADGTITHVADVPGVVGLAWWDGALWAASWTDDEGVDEGGLVRIRADGSTVRLRLVEPTRPNFLVPAPWGSLLVSDDFDTRIFEVTPRGDVTVWAEGLASPNGMGWSADGETLYVAATFSSPPALQAVTVANGDAGAVSTVHTWEAGTTPDGVETVATDVPTVASLAFGRGPFDACSVVATSLFGDAVSLVAVGREAP
ncbi:MAG TPA: SMP-30/gluconolactonase/LRE family protein, partial [Myxococcota bacterium]|nr:SMP-30/gluconolactonase/LRE family protein [Myxococcota bacterium]